MPDRNILDLKAKYSTDIMIGALDLDKEIEIVITDRTENTYVNTWLSVENAKAIVNFLQEQLKTLE